MLNLPEPPDKDKIITVSPSQLSVWQACNYKWNLTYKQGYTAGTSRAMVKGSMVHEMEDPFYSMFIGEPIYPVGMDILMDKIYMPLNEKYGMGDMYELIMFNWAWTTFCRYTDWAFQVDDFIPLATEQELWAPTDLEHDGKQIYLHGIIDLIVDREGELGVVDHKTYSSDKGKWTADLVYFDQQIAFYMLMLHLLGQTPQFGMINGINSYEYKQTPTTDKLFSREEVYHKPSRLIRYRDNIYGGIRNMFQAKDYPKTLTRNCAYCGYKEVCDNELRGLDPVPILKANHRRDVKTLTVEFPLEFMES